MKDPDTGEHGGLRLQSGLNTLRPGASEGAFFNPALCPLSCCPSGTSLEPCLPPQASLWPLTRWHWLGSPLLTTLPSHRVDCHLTTDRTFSKHSLVALGRVLGRCTPTATFSLHPRGSLELGVVAKSVYVGEHGGSVKCHNMSEVAQLGGSRDPALGIWFQKPVLPFRPEQYPPTSVEFPRLGASALDLQQLISILVTQFCE